MKTILIAEDEAVLAETITLFLKREGYRVLWAGEGTQAVKMIEAHHPDLVIADLVMPNMDGLQLLEWLRSQPGLSGIRLVLMTAKETVIEPLKRHRVEADAYLSKPFDKTTLLETVNGLISKD